MAKYRMLEYGKSMPEYTEDSFVASGKQDDLYSLAIGTLRILLTKEEKERTLDTWNKLDAGIDPTAGVN